MKIILNIILLVFFYLKSYSTDSCKISFSADCIKGNLKYLNNYVFIESKDKSISLINFHEKRKLVKGNYKFAIYSEFGDRIDTVINLEVEQIKIIFKIKWNYLFQKYSNEIFNNTSVPITIHYEKKFCGNANCHRDRDIMEITKMENGKYIARYFSFIITGENCTEYLKNDWSEKILDENKVIIINNYLKNNSILFDDKSLKECIVKIGNKIYNINKNSYLIFRKELLD